MRPSTVGVHIRRPATTDGPTARSDPRHSTRPLAGLRRATWWATSSLTTMTTASPTVDSAPPAGTRNAGSGLPIRASRRRMRPSLLDSQRSLRNAKVPLLRGLGACRRRDSNPRHADMIPGSLAQPRGFWARGHTVGHNRALGCTSFRVSRRVKSGAAITPAARSGSTITRPSRAHADVASTREGLARGSVSPPTRALSALRAWGPGGCPTAALPCAWDTCKMRRSCTALDGTRQPPPRDAQLH